MSEYIHEIVLQEFVIDNIADLDLTVQYKRSSRMKLVDAVANRKGTFWDLNAKLENGIWIPLEVEWISSNFLAHKHHKNSEFPKFKDSNGVLLVLRKNKELPEIQQISILDNFSEAQFKNKFYSWFKKKSPGYIDETLKTYMIGGYRREIPRIILYPLSQGARENYFAHGTLYKKNAADPAVIGFKPSGYDKNAFIRDLQPNDICLFLASDGKRGTRQEFKNRIYAQKLPLYRLTGYRIKQKITDKCTACIGIDREYWPDEIKSHQMIYTYICVIEDQPFFNRTDAAFPFVENFSDSTWEAFRSCIQYGEYREISPLDFTSLISRL